MRFKPLYLALCLPLTLTACGGGSSSGGNIPTQGIQNVTVDGQSAGDVVLEQGAPSTNHAINSNHLKSKDSAASQATVTIEYNGDKPTIPSSTSTMQIGPFSAVTCSNPVQVGDQCEQGVFKFTPQKASDQVSQAYFDNKLQIYAFVPFRIFPLKSGQTPFSVAGMPTRSNVALQYSVVDPDTGLTYNRDLIPATANFTDPSIDNGDALPFTLSKDANDDHLVDATYTYDSGIDIDRFIFALYIKNYSKNAQLSYASNNPPGGYDAGSTAPVSITLTRSLVITTDHGLAYVIPNPTQAKSMLEIYGVTENQLLTQYTAGKPINNISFPYRISSGKGTVASMGLFSPGFYDSSKELNHYIYLSKTVLGSVSGGPSNSMFDTLMSDNNGTPITPTTGNAAAYGHYNLVDTGSYYRAALVKGTPNYELILTNIGENNQGIITPTSQAAIPLTGGVVSMPSTLNISNMAIATKVASDKSASVYYLITGSNGSQYENYAATLTYADVSKNEAKLSDLTKLPDSTLAPTTFTYYSYNSSSSVAKMLTPQQYLVAFNPSTKQLAITSPISSGGNSGTIDMSKAITGAASAMNIAAMSCNDTDVNTTPVTNTCYVLMSDKATGKDVYTMYQLSNIDPNAVGAITTTITPLSLSLTTTSPLKKAVIDNQTGSLLTFGADDSVNLYTLSGTTYGTANAITLPKTADSKTQVATNIYQY